MGTHECTLYRLHTFFDVDPLFPVLLACLRRVPYLANVRISRAQVESAEVLKVNPYVLLYSRYRARPRVPCLSYPVFLAGLRRAKEIYVRRYSSASVGERRRRRIPFWSRDVGDGCDRTLVGECRNAAGYGGSPQDLGETRSGGACSPP